MVYFTSNAHESKSKHNGHKIAQLHKHIKIVETYKMKVMEIKSPKVICDPHQKVLSPIHEMIRTCSL